MKLLEKFFRKKAITYLGKGGLKYFDGNNEFYIDTNNLQIKRFVVEIFWKEIKVYNQPAELREVEQKKIALKVKDLLEKDNVEVVITPDLPLNL